MKASMLNHGLDVPKLMEDEDCFVVILPGAGDNLDRIRVSKGLESGTVTSLMNELNERQKAILNQAVIEGEVTTRWCMKHFGVARDTVHRDLTYLVSLSILKRKGSGRSVKYVIKQDDSNV